MNPICCPLYKTQFFNLLFPVETETRPHKLVFFWREMGRGGGDMFCDRCLPPHAMFYSKAVKAAKMMSLVKLISKD